jgi:antitoxin (DNA-binding transcriptional repressor) of toxin-antitoxin stability system
MKINALQLRQSLGRILDRLKQEDEPIIIEKGREPVAVLISLRLFRERFVDFREEQKRRQLLEQFRQSAATPAVDSLKALRELRYGADY